jgi:1,4-dihydroxy-2-naphthoate octaprenyltransferase
MKKGCMMGAAVWLKGLRIPLYWASGAPVLLTYALAFRNGKVLHPLMWLAGAVALFVFEVGVNLIAEVADKSEGVFVTQGDTWIPTGPFLIDTTGLPAERIARYAALVFTIAALLGFYLAFETGFIVIILIGVAGFILTVVYAVPPFMLGARGVGEPIPFIAFGPLPALALYFLLTGELSAMAVIVTLPASFWITAVRYAHHLPDRSSRRVSRFMRIYQWRIGNAFLMQTVFLVFGMVAILPIYSLYGPFILVPLAVSALLSYPPLRHTHSSTGNAVDISRGTKYYVALQLGGSVAMAAALLLA